MSVRRRDVLALLTAAAVCQFAGATSASILMLNR